MQTATLSDRRRWGIVALLSASIAINLIDRQVLSLAAPVLRDELRLSATEYGYILFAFQLGMLLGQVPAGLFLDGIGVRAGFVIIFVAWSAVNALHGLARGFLGLVGLRFLLGVAECGNYSGGIKVIAGLFEAKTRAVAGGIFNGGAQLGAILAPPLVVSILVDRGWRAAFLLPSALGLVWLLPWLLAFPKSSQEAASASGLGEATHRGISLRRLLGKRQVVGLLFFRGTSGPLTSFYWYWLPEYLRHGRGMSLATIGLLAWIPYLAGSAGNVAGGFFSSLLIRGGAGEDRARKAGFVTGAVLSSVSALLPWVTSTAGAIGLICAAVFGNQWMVANYIGMMGDLFPSEVVATVNGISGVADSGVGMLVLLLTGVVVDRFSYLPVLVAAGILPALSVLSVYWGVGRIGPVAIEE
jgi:MFS transporter, ACS family, hexuronate transporter